VGSTLAEQIAAKREAERRAAADRWDGIRRGTVTVESTPEMLARINAVMDGGRTDQLRGGPYRIFEGRVGEERMISQVTALGDDVVICFWSRDAMKERRLLVTAGEDGRPECWLHTEGTEVFPHEGKYSRAATTILAIRAHEKETGILR